MSEVVQPAPKPPALVYRRRPGLAGLVLRNLGLNLVTLWFYRFWAKTRWRKHIWSNATLLGDPIEYTGTGGEMFKGFLVALAFVAPFFIVFGIWEAVVADSGPGLWIERIVYFAALYGLILAAGFYARRYRLSRTRWRGVALVLDAKFADYAKFALRTQARNALTFFTMTPRASLAIEAWLISRTRFGAVNFDCAPDWRPAMKPWLIFLGPGLFVAAMGQAWLVEVAPELYPDLGLPRISGWWIALAALVAVPAFFAYRVALLRATAGGARLGAAGFACAARATPIVTYLGVCILTYLTVLFLAGLSMAVTGVFGGVAVFAVALGGFVLIRDAWVAPWIVDHVVNSTAISNADVLDAIAAGNEDAMTRGEGLADSFDVGIG